MRFVSGRRYVYFDVPAEQLRDLEDADPKGRYFNLQIRDHYRYREITTADRR